MKDFPNKTITGLIAKKSETLGERLSEEESKFFIYEILFEFKLLTLRNKFSRNYTSQYLEEYFNELGMVLNLYGKMQNTVKLSQIF